MVKLPLHDIQPTPVPAAENRKVPPSNVTFPFTLILPLNELFVP